MCGAEVWLPAGYSVSGGCAPPCCAPASSFFVGRVLESDYECLTDAPREAVGLTLDIWTVTHGVLEHGQLRAVPRREAEAHLILLKAIPRDVISRCSRARPLAMYASGWIALVRGDERVGEWGMSLRA